MKTEVKALGDYEYQVRVRLPREEYERVYAEKARQLSREVELPGFRAGRVPRRIVERRFAAKLHEDTLSELIESHSIKAIEASGLMPAVQPELSIPAEQGEDGFEFLLRVTTWPKPELKPLDELEFDETIITVDDADVDMVIKRLLEEPVRFEEEEERKAEKGDRLRIDFFGYIDGEPFAGGDGENVELVLGEGRLIPGFEEQLIGQGAGDRVTVEVTFPDEKRYGSLAGKKASFATTVKSVARPVYAENEEELARERGFEDAQAQRADIKEKLTWEAEDASFDETRKSALEALLAANAITLPEALVAEEMRMTAQRLAREGRQQLLEDEAFRKELRAQIERALKTAILLRAVCDLGGIGVDDRDLEDEIENRARIYPLSQRKAFKHWIRESREELERLREGLLERKCVEYIVAQARTRSIRKTISEWRAQRERQKENE